jgi:hypothetical protein
MHAITFLQTADWVVQQFRPETIEFLFEWGFHQAMRPNRDERMRAEANQQLIRCVYDVAKVRERIEANAEALQILSEFGLKQILDEEWTVRVLSSATRTSEEDSGRPHELLNQVSKSWSVFKQCIDPLSRLLTPTVIQNEKDFDEILTLEISVPGAVAGIPSDVIEKLVEHTGGLYRAFCEITNSSRDALTLVYMVSGSQFRFDFKGLGEPIRALKEMFVELWQRIRHRKAEDLRSNSTAVTESLTALHQIELCRQNGVISDEDASRLRHTIVDDALGIFDRGALIREIPDVEQVENVTLIGEVQQKLLAAPPSGTYPDSGSEELDEPTSSTAKIKKKPTKKRSKTRPRTKKKKLD